MLNVYRHEEWHDFFVMVGGAAAALAGLVFVAMSLNLATIFQDPTHRFRAIGTLAGLHRYLRFVRSCSWAVKIT
jgi:hypothetical protein